MDPPWASSPSRLIWGIALIRGRSLIQSGNVQVPTPRSEDVTARHGHLGRDLVSFVLWTDAHMDPQVQGWDSQSRSQERPLDSGEQCQLILARSLRPLALFIRSCSTVGLAK